MKDESPQGFAAKISTVPLFFPIFLFLLLTAGCGGAVSPSTLPNATVATTPSATLVPTVPVSPLLAESVLPTPTPIPTVNVAAVQPEPGKGALIGVILVRGTSGEMRPVREVKLALGEILKDEDGNERVVGYDPATAPSTITDANGAFVFENVKPGRYGLILDIVMSSFLLFDEDSGAPLFVDVPADTVVDLGVLEYEALPIPPQP